MNPTPSEQSAPNSVPLSADLIAPGELVNLSLNFSSAPDERRALPRHECRIPLTIIPVNDDESPGEIRWADATSIDVSATGLGFVVTSEEPIVTKLVVVGTESTSGSRAFATLKLESQTKIDGGKYRIGGSWQIGNSDDVLLAEKLRPVLKASTLSFGFSTSEAALQQWTKKGVLRRHMVDQILVCNKCESLPSWRKGCTTCSSGRIHVDSDRFDCMDCGERGSTPKLSALCHACMDRFDVGEAKELPLYAYCLLYTSDAADE